MVIFRVQDREGRGPWRPGFSLKWSVDRPEEDYAKLQPWMAEFGYTRKIRNAIKNSHVGCGCISLDQLRMWILLEEYVKLRGYGYAAYAIPDCKALEQSDIQTVFSRKQPLYLGAEEVPLY